MDRRGEREIEGYGGNGELGALRMKGVEKLEWREGERRKKEGNA